MILIEQRFESFQFSFKQSISQIGLFAFCDIMASVRRVINFLVSDINIGAIFIFILFLFIFLQKTNSYLGSSEYVFADFSLTTTSRFSQKVRTKKTAIPFKIIYEEDKELDFGKQTAKQEGEEGLKEEDIKTLYYDGKFYSEEIVDTRVVQPKNKIITKGVKQVLKTIDTESGKLNAYGSLRVWATSYDKNCIGCNEWTATGRRLEKGIIAVDPKVIPLHTKIYVPGYGIGYAEDVGGAIRGNKIDLGYEAVGEWSARWVEIYFVK